MNERIQELAKWAGYNGHYATEEFDINEFARLILLECADIVDRAICDGGVDGRLVKEHFGVEE